MPSTTGRADTGILRELTTEECWRRLEEHHVGRVSYIDRGYPVILPLNYTVRDGHVLIRTASYNQLAIHLPGQRAAFEIDHVDEHTRTGWSVLVRGVAEHVTDVRHAHVAGEAEATPWPDGVRSMVLRIEPVEISGRHLQRRDPSSSGPSSSSTRD